MAEILIGGMPIEAVDDDVPRLVILIWGDAGIGKTTLAATAPGRKLHLCFDPDGHLSIKARKDVDTIRLANMSDADVTKFKGDALNISKALETGKYGAVILDSLTAIADKTLGYGIAMTKGATLERPSPGAYGARNNYLIELVRNLIRITGKYNVHLIITAHEDAPEKGDDGGILQIGMLLGGKITNGIGHRINEIWYMGEDSKNNKRIAIRPVRMRKPMKTRMFKTSGAPEFMWDYDADELEGEGIDTWFQAWKDNDYKKIPVPGS